MSEEILKILIFNYYDPLFQINIRVNKFTRDGVKQTLDYLKNNMNLIKYKYQNNNCIECGDYNTYDSNTSLCYNCLFKKVCTKPFLTKKYPILKNDTFKNIIYYDHKKRVSKFYLEENVIRYGIVKYGPNLMLPPKLRITAAKQKRITQIKKLNINPNSDIYHYCAEQYIISPRGGIKSVKNKIHIFNNIIDIINIYEVNNIYIILDYFFKDKMIDINEPDENIIHFVYKCHAYDEYLNNLEHDKLLELKKIRSIYKDSNIFRYYNITHNYAISIVNKYLKIKK